MKFLLGFILLISLVHSELDAQMFPQHSLWMVDKYQSNPAFGGLERSLSVNFNYRSQWNRIPGSPKTLYLNAHMPVYLLDGGVGTMVMSDKTGLLSTNVFKLSYNRVMAVERNIFSFGAAVGIESTRLDGPGAITPDGIYTGSIFSHEDLLLSEQADLGISPTYSLGIAAVTPFFQAGLAIHDLAFPAGKAGELIVRDDAVINLFASKNFSISDFLLISHLQFKSNLRNIQTDIGFLVKNGNIFGGINLRGYNRRSIDGISFIAGIKLNESYRLSYSYDLGLSTIGQFSSGSHEININFNLNRLIGIGLLPEIIYNPRNL